MISEDTEGDTKIALHVVVTVRNIFCSDPAKITLGKISLRFGINSFSFPIFPEKRGEYL